METKDYLTNYYERYDENGRLISKQVVSRVMRKIDFGIWQKSIAGGASAPLGYFTAVRVQMVKGGVSRWSCH